MTTTDEVLKALEDMGIVAHSDFGPGPTEIVLPTHDDVGWPAASILIAREFNREDGGWEGVEDWDGSQSELPDGPAKDVSAYDVARWAARLLP